MVRPNAIHRRPVRSDARDLGATARAMKVAGGRRLLFLSTVAACVIAVVVTVIFFAEQREGPPAQPETAPITKAPAKEKTDIYEKQLEAEIALVKAKISRLKMMARLSPNKTQHLAAISALEKELKEISGKPEKEKKNEKKEDGKTSTPEKEGERYV